MPNLKVKIFIIVSLLVVSTIIIVSILFLRNLETRMYDEFIKRA